MKNKTLYFAPQSKTINTNCESKNKFKNYWNIFLWLKNELRNLFFFFFQVTNKRPNGMEQKQKNMATDEKAYFGISSGVVHTLALQWEGPYF